jgi:hypothetical protein
MKARRVTFPCADLKLEGIYFDGEWERTVPAVVVCHPHPLYGGSMRNNVTYAVADALGGVAMATFLFNFRGVGGSEGSYGGGIMEQQDIVAALDWVQVQKGIDESRLGLAGYSFGAGVALPVACADARVKGIALISPYFETSPMALLKTCRKPGLLLGGSNDCEVSPEVVASYGCQAVGTTRLRVIEGPDHFWAGYEQEMGQAVTDFFSELFK